MGMRLIRSFLVILGVCCAASIAAADPPLPAETTAASPSERLEHLHQAARHLLAAGLADEAKLVQQRAEREQRAVDQAILMEKLAQLEMLQNQIAELKERLNPPEHVALQLQLLSVKPEQWKPVAEELREAADTEEDSFVLSEAAEVDEFVSGILAAKQAKVVAQPMLLTLIGETAKMFTGGAVPTGVAKDGESLYEQVGLSIEATTVRSENGELQVSVDLQHSELVTLEDTPSPVRQTQQVKSNQGLQWDQTMAVLVEMESQGETKPFILLVKPQRYDTATNTDGLLMGVRR